MGSLEEDSGSDLDGRDGERSDSESCTESTGERVKRGSSEQEESMLLDSDCDNANGTDEGHGEKDETEIWSHSRLRRPSLAVPQAATARTPSRKSPDKKTHSSPPQLAMRSSEASKAGTGAPATATSSAARLARRIDEYDALVSSPELSPWNESARTPFKRKLVGL